LLPARIDHLADLRHLLRLDDTEMIAAAIADVACDSGDLLIVEFRTEWRHNPAAEYDLAGEIVGY
jgi:hypothetical protein